MIYYSNSEPVYFNAPSTPQQPAPNEKKKTLSFVAWGAALTFVVLATFVSAIVGVIVGVSLASTDAAAPVTRPAYEFKGDTNDTVAGVLSQNIPTVVAIRVQGSTLGRSAGVGSGVIISPDGTVLTNAHVIGSATQAVVVDYEGKEFQAELVGSFPQEDVAIIQVIDVPPEGFSAATLGDSDDTQVGDQVLAIGNALDLGTSPTVTQGIISSKGRTLQAGQTITLRNLLQTDTAINPGNSGGSLVNSRGEVIGINTAIIDGADNIGFAIPVNQIKPLIDSIEAGGGEIRSDQGFLGVVSSPTSEISPQDLQTAGQDTAFSDGVFVTEVLAGSPAELAGIKKGDIVVEINGVRVESAEKLAEEIRSSDAGQEIRIVVRRGDQDVEIVATLSQRGDFGG